MIIQVFILYLHKVTNLKWISSSILKKLFIYGLLIHNRFYTRHRLQQMMSPPTVCQQSTFLLNKMGVVLVKLKILHPSMLVTVETLHSSSLEQEFAMMAVCWLKSKLPVI